jgi:DHA3 family multidrug efflux protein-like MFS transporter
VGHTDRADGDPPGHRVLLHRRQGRIADLGTPWFWVFAVVLLAGAVVEQLRNIALSTTVTLLVPEERRANANGLVGTVQGMAMLVTSVFSGLSVGFLGMGWTLLIGVAVMALTLLHLVTVRIPEHEVLQSDDATGWVDIRGGWLAVIAVPGLLALVLFTTLNNLFGGVQMALMDPYGIDLFGVQGWGIWFAVASTGLFVGGGVIAKWGLGGNPIRTMLLFAGRDRCGRCPDDAARVGLVVRRRHLLMMAFIPAVEAAEQTVIQKVVPYGKQGRVFGFAMTFEAATAPVTALLVAPLAEWWVIPHLDTEQGARQWEWLLGTGDSRGIALILVAAGVFCVVLAVAAMCTPQYRRLSRSYVGSTDTAASTSGDVA